MKSMTFSYPDGFESALRLTPDELAAQVRLMAALKMFELGKLSSGKAAELAGMSRVDFFDMCARYRVPVFNYETGALETELRADIEAAHHARA
jgi:predicted HTH domain antitoxin